MNRYAIILFVAAAIAVRAQDEPAKPPEPKRPPRPPI